MPQQIIGQALGIIGTILTFVSYQAKTKRSLLIIQSSATLCICISYLLLGATAGFALTVVSLVRNAVFYMQKEKTRAAYVSAGILALAMTVVGFFLVGGMVLADTYRSTRGEYCLYLARRQSAFAQEHSRHLDDGADI